jgi:hypothetical protein
MVRWQLHHALTALSLFVFAPGAWAHADCCGEDACDGCEEVMSIEIGARSYDGSMWYCVDGQDRYYDQYMYAADPEGYIASLPAHKRPAMRTLADGTQEADIIDYGDIWVSATRPSDGERHNYFIASDGYHAVKTPIFLPAVEGIPGKDYLKKTNFKTIPITHKRLREIGERIAAGRKIDSFECPYKGTDFLIDFLMEIVDEPTKEYLRESRLNWPKAAIFLDKYYINKLGEKASAFVRHGIPLGDTPPRDHLSLSYHIENPKAAPAA